jgi:hypothetical protein
MIRRTILSIALTCSLFTSAAAADRNILAPFRFQSPAEKLDSIDRDRAIIYRNQLQRQERELEHAQAQGRLDSLGRRQQLDTQSELDRMNEVLGSPQVSPLQLPETRSLPSLRLQIIPRYSP